MSRKGNAIIRRPGSCLLLTDITQAPKLTKEVRGPQKWRQGQGQHKTQCSTGSVGGGMVGRKTGATTMMIWLIWPDEVINTLCDEGKRKALFKECATGKRNATREAGTKLSREQII